MRVKSILAVLLILGISIALTSAVLSMGTAPHKRSIAGAEAGKPEGLLMNLRIPIIFVDANGDGYVESFKNARSGETIYTFPSPIARPQTGMLEISGTLTISGGQMSTDKTMVMVY